MSEMKFRQFLESVDLNDIRAMILRALGGNSGSKEAFNAPLVQFCEPGEILNRLNSLKGLSDLIKNSGSAQDAIQNAAQNNLTVGQLVMILSQQ